MIYQLISAAHSKANVYIPFIDFYFNFIDLCPELCRGFLQQRGSAQFNAFSKGHFSFFLPRREYHCNTHDVSLQF